MEQVKAKNEETMKNEEEKQGAKRMGQRTPQEGRANPGPWANPSPKGQTLSSFFRPRK